MSDMLGGRYRFEGVLWRDGDGDLFRACDLLLDQPVWILLPRMSKGENAVAWLSRRQRVSELKSEHLVRVFDVGKFDNGAAYTVMESLEGMDLQCWLLQYRPLPIEQAVDFVLQACHAVAEAHSRGIVHRDIKPANLFVVERPAVAPSVKVLDWGLSNLLGSASSKPELVHDDLESGEPTASVIVGTPLYMSPEQWLCYELDEPTDIWSLGDTLCEMVTGQAPFDPRNITHPLALRHHLLSSVASGEPLRLRDPFPALPRGLEVVIRTCLETDRARRYQNMAELAVALLEFGSERSRPLVDRICSFPKRFS